MLTHEDPPLLFASLAAFTFWSSASIGSSAANIAHDDSHFGYALFPFVTHFIAWCYSCTRKSDKYFDFTFASTFFLVALHGFMHSPSSSSPRKMLVLACVLTWVCRLGLFLFKRILRRGHDFRHDDIKHTYCFNAFAHGSQALWVELVSLAPLLLMSSGSGDALNAFDALGFLIFCVGLTMEHVADAQKTAWLERHPHKETYIAEGLWRTCRHPNYGGETLVHVGIYVMCLSGYDTVEHMLLGMVSPIFSGFFLLQTSVRLLRILHDEKFRNDPGYHAHVESSTVFFPIAALFEG